MNTQHHQRSPEARTNGYTLSPADQRRGTALFHQQCWHWGQDIRRPEGNRLLEYGFTCHRRPAGVDGSNLYQLDLASDWSIVLWGFGLFCGSKRSGGIFLQRYGFLPLLLPQLVVEPVPYLPAQVGAGRDATTTEERQLVCMLLHTTVCWIGRYETWVVASYGLDYRQQCINNWANRVQCIPAHQIATEWSSLALRCAAMQPVV